MVRAKFSGMRTLWHICFPFVIRRFFQGFPKPELVFNYGTKEKPHPCLCSACEDRRRAAGVPPGLRWCQPQRAIHIQSFECTNRSCNRMRSARLRLVSPGRFVCWMVSVPRCVRSVNLCSLLTPPPGIHSRCPLPLEFTRSTSTHYRNRQCSVRKKRVAQFFLKLFPGITGATSK